MSMGEVLPEEHQLVHQKRGGAVVPMVQVLCQILDILEVFLCNFGSIIDARKLCYGKNMQRELGLQRNQGQEKITNATRTKANRQPPTQFTCIVAAGPSTSANQTRFLRPCQLQLLTHSLRNVPNAQHNPLVGRENVTVAPGLL